MKESTECAACRWEVTCLPSLWTVSGPTFRGVPLRSSAAEVVVDFTLAAEAGSGGVKREAPPEPPEVRSREPFDPPAPETTKHQ